MPQAGPLLAGNDGVVWLRRRDDAVLDLWAADAAGGARLVQRFVAADGNRLSSPRLSVSAAAVALELFEVSPRRGSRVVSRSYSGAFGLPLTEVAQRSLAQLPALPAAPPAATGGVRFTDAGAQRAVWVARSCRGSQIRTIALPGRPP